MKMIVQYIRFAQNLGKRKNKLNFHNSIELVQLLARESWKKKGKNSPVIRLFLTWDEHFIIEKNGQDRHHNCDISESD